MEHLVQTIGLSDMLDLYSPIWNNWAGLLCVIVIAVSCVFNIYSHWVDDSAADRIYYWAMLITSVGAAMGYFGHSANPKVLVQTYLVIVSVRFVSNILEKVTWHYFSGESVRKARKR